MNGRVLLLLVAVVSASVVELTTTNFHNLT